MYTNLVDIVVLVFFMVFCVFKPKIGILSVFGLILFFPVAFSFFGISFGQGQKYLPNVFIIEIFFFIIFLFRKKNILSDSLDVLIIVYMLLVFLISLFTSKFTLDLGVFVKQFLMFPLFYFMGKIYITRPSNDKWLKVFINVLMFLGIYMIFLIIFEYFTKLNIMAFLETNFMKMVGSQVVSDPFNQIRDQIRSNYFRAIGPQLEPTEAALIVFISFVVYLIWQIKRNMKLFFVKEIILFTLFLLIIILGTRTIILMMFVSLLFYFFYLQQNKLKLLRHSFILLFVGGVITLLIYLGFFNRIFFDFQNSAYFVDRINDEGTIYSRIFAWQFAINQIYSHIIFGVGVGIPIYALDYKGASIFTTHNLFLDDLLFQGFFLFIILIIIWVKLIKNDNKIIKLSKDKFHLKIAKLHILLFVGMIIFGIFSPEKLQISSLFWFIGGINRQQLNMEGIKL